MLNKGKNCLRPVQLYMTFYSLLFSDNIEVKLIDFLK